MTPFVDRMIRAAKLDVNLYEEVEADKNAMSQAVGVVALSSLAGGIGFMQTAGLTGLVIGNTAAKMLAVAECSVLTVKPDDFVSPIQLED